MPNPKPSRKNLLIAFDAFGTLFTPRAPIGALYGEIARKHGICSDVSDEEIMRSFKKAYKHNATARPNFGKEVGMDPTAWWSSLITETFTPFLPSATTTTVPPALPHRLIPDLLTRFASRDGYTLYDDVVPLFTTLRAARNNTNTTTTTTAAAAAAATRRPRRKIVTAVLTNSDDRVAGILRSFGLRVGHTDPKTVERMMVVVGAAAGRAEAPVMEAPLGGKKEEKEKNVEEGKEGREEGGEESLGDGDSDNDIDFVLTSYDCGYEKPHRAMFDAARRLAVARYGADRGRGRDRAGRVVVGEEEAEAEAEDGSGGGDDGFGEWEAVYVGDEVDKDVVGAENAGWAPAFLVDREGLLGDAAGGVVTRRDVGGHGEKEVRVLRDLRELQSYVLG
ncbi:haloacid dehalogenase [Diplodia corticola]|uniref:Haloacid dehalogenase n=1 Tax=Diplodia corticola TaxID=236234 RepID=A0A1J9SJQ6_9PEZI|nr:haloacid dehalogenase [Diplodia corticola]OJD39988.1 haloacid dehalogenase [Diplodia corticola]